MTERHLVDLAYLEAATALLQRVRAAHPTAGLLEAADVQWWWCSPRSTDRVPQPFWFDASGRPVAAVIATDWGDAVALDPIVLPDAAPAWVARHLLAAGIERLVAAGARRVKVYFQPGSTAARRLYLDAGFEMGKETVVYTRAAAPVRS